jgi:hypothetical protein
MSTIDLSKAELYQEVKDLYDTFNYPNARAARRAIRIGTFPVEVFIINTRYCVMTSSVVDFFEKHRDQGLEANEWINGLGVMRAALGHAHQDIRRSEAKVKRLRAELSRVTGERNDFAEVIIDSGIIDTKTIEVEGLSSLSTVPSAT